MSARHLKWSELPSDSPMARITRQRVIGEKMMVSRVRLEPGFLVPTHRHENEQLVVVLEGRCRFWVEDGAWDGAAGPGPTSRVVDLRAGEVMHLPANVPHGCEALEPTLILDLFSPVSERTGVDAGPRG